MVVFCFCVLVCVFGLLLRYFLHLKYLIFKRKQTKKNVKDTQRTHHLQGDNNDDICLKMFVENLHKLFFAYLFTVKSILNAQWVRLYNANRRQNNI